MDQAEDESRRDRIDQPTQEHGAKGKGSEEGGQTETPSRFGSCALDDYGRSISRLASLESGVKYLLGAHRSARVDAGRLGEVEAAFQKLRSGKFSGDAESGNRMIFVIDGVEFVTTQPVLDGKQGDVSKGGSGLDTWP